MTAAILNSDLLIPYLPARDKDTHKGDKAAEQGQQGTFATDLLPHIRAIVNS
tara:strand:- start:7642 stop:7797 length:156 start_codon:yes stop_codon:yes gene_type:complete